MATAHELRRAALQALFQIDAHGEGGAEPARAWIQSDDTLSSAQREEALSLAKEAYAQRSLADEAMQRLAPAWPVHRQAAVDRAILRLAYHEMRSGRVHPKVAISEAVELAKEFSTDRSPAFVNALLDKVMHELAPGDQAAGA